MAEIKDGKMVAGVGTVASAIAGVVCPPAGAAITILSYISGEILEIVNERKQVILTEGYLEAASETEEEILIQLKSYADTSVGAENILEFCKKAVLTHSDKAVRLMGKMLYNIESNKREMEQKDFIILALLSEMNDYDIDNLREIHQIYEIYKKPYQQGILLSEMDIERYSSDKTALCATLKKLETNYVIDVFDEVTTFPDEKDMTKFFMEKHFCFNIYGNAIIQLIEK